MMWWVDMLSGREIREVIVPSRNEKDEVHGPKEELIHITNGHLRLEVLRSSADDLIKELNMPTRGQQ